MGCKINPKMIGSRISKYRLVANLTQAELAEMVSVSDGTISNYERGIIEKLDYELLTHIADVFDITLNDLMPGGTEPPKVSDAITGCKLVIVTKSEMQHTHWIMCAGEEYRITSIKDITLGRSDPSSKYTITLTDSEGESVKEGALKDVIMEAFWKHVEIQQKVKGNRTRRPPKDR